MAFSGSSGVTLPLPQAGAFLYPQDTSDPRGTPLRLGSITFRDQEHPSHLPLAVSQMTAEHLLIGGGKVVQSLGVQPKDVTWTGRLGPDASALPRVAELNRICTGGKPQRLSWGTFAFDVIVTSFVPTIRHQNLVEYSITVKIIADRSGQITTSAAPSVNVQVQNLYQQAYTRAGNLAALDSTTASWQTSIAGVGDQLNNLGPIASATASSISPITSAINSIIAKVQTYLGPLYSATPTSIVAQKLGLSQGILGNLQLIMGNLGRGQVPKSVQVIGGSVYDLAAQYYGDVTLYQAIMQANSLLHPTFAPGLLQTIIIPPAVSSGGPS